MVFHININIQYVVIVFYYCLFLFQQKSLLSDHPLKIDMPDLLSTSSELPNFSSSKSQINFELSNSSRKCIPPELKPVTLTKKKSNYTRKGFIALEEDISLQNEVSNFIPWFPQLRMTYPQLENINNNVRVLNMLKRKLADINYEKFNEISFPIDYSKCDLNGIMNPRYSYEVDTALDDPYDRHLAKLKEMRKKPLCIIVIGKPGLALYNLAAEIANTWDNILITRMYFSYILSYLKLAYLLNHRRFRCFRSKCCRTFCLCYCVIKWCRSIHNHRMYIALTIDSLNLHYE